MRAEDEATDAPKVDDNIGKAQDASKTDDEVVQRCVVESVLVLAMLLLVFV